MVSVAFGVWGGRQLAIVSVAKWAIAAVVLIAAAIVEFVAS